MSKEPVTLRKPPKEFFDFALIKLPTKEFRVSLVLGFGLSGMPHFIFHAKWWAVMPENGDGDTPEWRKYGRIISRG